MKRLPKFTKEDMDKLTQYPVFVYGTLKKGFRLHRPLENCKFLGNATIPAAMITLGAFPAVIKVGETQSTVKGEIYEITNRILLALDIVESEGSLYRRRLIRAQPGNRLVWTYELMRVPDNWGNAQITSGVWNQEHAHKDIAL